MYKYAGAALLLIATTASLVHANIVNYPEEENNSTAGKECEHKDSGILSEHDRTLVSLTRALDQIADSLSEAEQDLLADLLDNDSCPDEVIEEVIEEYDRGTLYSARTKRNTCQIDCRKGNSEVNCSGRCKCKCNWWGRAKCKCCGSFWC